MELVIKFFQLEDFLRIMLDNGYSVEVLKAIDDDVFIKIK